MATKVQPRLPQGMRDILPEQMVRRQWVMDVIRGVFEEFGFEPLQTPVLELKETLSGKYGSEADRLIYSASYAGKEESLMLRYDLSVPLSRVVAMHPELPMPFKRYQIAPVWRADRPGRGRYREFYQCDADTIGVSSMLADAETVAVIYSILDRLGFRAFTTHISHRKILDGIGRFAGVPGVSLRGLYQSIDKLPKVGPDGVAAELLSVGLPDPVLEAIRRVARLYLQGKLGLDRIASRLREEQIPGADSSSIPFPDDLTQALTAPLTEVLARETPGRVEPDRVQEQAGQLVTAVLPTLRAYYQESATLIPDSVVDRLLALLDTQGDNRAILKALAERLADDPEALTGIAELEEMLHILDLFGVPERALRIDLSMARGLEYYTGPIHETFVEEAGVGSVTGGGRYDNLIGLFAERSLPATGATIGIERILVVMEEQGMFPPAVGRTTTQVLVTVFSPELVDASVKVTALLRSSGLRTQLYTGPARLRDQIGYATGRGIPVIVILGPDEVADDRVTLRDLRNRRQETVMQAEALTLVQAWLA